MDEMTKRELGRLAQIALEDYAPPTTGDRLGSYFAAASPQNILNLLEENRALQIELMRKTLALCSLEQRLETHGGQPISRG